MFNLYKQSQTDDGSVLPGQIEGIVQDDLESTRQQLNTNIRPVSDQTSGDAMKGLDAQQKDAVLLHNENMLMQAILPLVEKYEARLSSNGLPPSDILNQIQQLPEFMRLKHLSRDDLSRQVHDAFQGQGGVTNKMLSDYEAFRKNIDQMLNSDFSARMRTKSQNLPGAVPGMLGRGASFNFSQYKESQLTGQELDERFPVSSVGDFIEKFLQPLMAWNGQQEERDAISGKSLEAIRAAVGQGFEEEANSALKSIQRMQAGEIERATEILAYIYDKWLSPMVKAESEKQIMSEKVDGIIKHDLSDHVLNNKEAICSSGCQKTASANQSQEYTLYGPESVRVCPKLRGRFSNGNDVVSEYICRHHCNMGLVLDDARTVCGEAVWRGHVMDKFSREYVNEKGEIEGGYINKRFEINRNVPEENKIRLKPGEIRKPRPVEMFGSMEARMQEMRNKEGKQRDYRPETDTTKPFNWNKDVDQNNVEVAQDERDRREEDSGHQLVQYKNKDQQENKPALPKKSSFNLNSFKKASIEKESYALTNTLFHELQQNGKLDLNNPPPDLQGLNPDELSMAAHELVQKQMAQWGQGQTLIPYQQQFVNWPPRSAFNLQQHKTAARDIFVKWQGVGGDTLLGKIIGNERMGDVDVERIDGTQVRVPKHRLQPASYEEIEQAVKAGRPMIPTTTISPTAESKKKS